MHKRTSKVLPRAQPSYYLYEFAIPEDQYIASQLQLSSYFTQPDVRGVYETQVGKERKKTENGKRKIELTSRGDISCVDQFFFSFLFCFIVTTDSFILHLHFH